MGTIQGFCASIQARAIWPGVALVLSDPLKQVNQGPVRLSIFRIEAWDGIAEVETVERRRFVDCPGQETFAVPPRRDCCFQVCAFA
jgi:hypothetical protein